MEEGSKISGGKMKGKMEKVKYTEEGINKDLSSKRKNSQCQYLSKSKFKVKKKKKGGKGKKKA